jgi:hypothetical protein
MLAPQTDGVQVPIWPRAAVHDTVAAIVKQAAYRRELSTTLLDRVMQWIQEALARLIESFRGVPHGRLVATVAAVIVGILIVARVVYAARLRAGVLEEGERRVGVGGGARDPWREAERLAASGQFTDAAHALYRATVGLLAASGLIRRHDSKTSGDYARELRRRGTPAYAAFRRFGSLYDRIIYGDGVCNASEYTALLEAARSVTVRGSERAA